MPRSGATLWLKLGFKGAFDGILKPWVYDHPGVDVGRRDLGVPERFLDDLLVAAGQQQAHRVTVPQSVKIDRLERDPNPLTVPASAFDFSASETAASPARVIACFQSRFMLAG